MVGETLIPVSAIQHYLYCPRRFGLVFLEREWEDNRFTAEGTALHRRVDQPTREFRDGVLVVRGLALRSTNLNLIGRSDVVEFHTWNRGEDKSNFIQLDGLDGWWRPAPVEYKRGGSRNGPWYKAQLCAQALCLEEMLGVEIQQGFIYLGKTKKKHDVLFDGELRALTKHTVNQIDECLVKKRTPAPTTIVSRCRRCSLKSICLPEVLRKRTSLSTYLARNLISLNEESGK